MKKVLRVCAFALGVALLLNAALMLMIANFNLGPLLVLGCGALLILFATVLFSSEKLRPLRIIIVCGFALVLVGSGVLAGYGCHDNVTGQEDAVIVLGCGIRGENVSAALAFRLNKAIDVWRAHPDTMIVVCGGQGPQETIPEAEAMERYLTERGVPKTQILQEDQSKSTLENLKNSAALLDEAFPQGYTAALVTSRFHIFRAVKIAQTMGLSVTHLGARIRWYAVPMNYLRELLAVANELRRGTMQPLAVMGLAV